MARDIIRVNRGIQGARDGDTYALIKLSRNAYDCGFLIEPNNYFQEFYPEGHYIIKQDTLGDKFYILSEGRVKVTKTNKGKNYDGYCNNLM